MKAIRCDRCNKYYSIPQGTSLFLSYGKKTAGTGTLTEVTACDMCQNCIKSLKKWISNVPEGVED